MEDRFNVAPEGGNSSLMPLMVLIVEASSHDPGRPALAVESLDPNNRSTSINRFVARKLVNFNLASTWKCMNLQPLICDCSDDEHPPDSHHPDRDHDE